MLGMGIAIRNQCTVAIWFETWRMDSRWRKSQRVKSGERFRFMNAEEKTDFENWAKLLIRRKVPDDYQHLIDSEVIKTGEIILKRGDAFEIHIRLQKSGESSTPSPVAKSRSAQILVTPLPPPRRFTRL